MGLGLIRPPLSCSVTLRRPSTKRLTSRSNRRPKSLNIVEPPESTIFLYSPLLTSIGQFCTTWSTVSEMGTVKSGFANWVKENFWAQKPFVTDIYIEKFFRYAVHTTVLFDVFLRICVEFIKLFGYVRTYIAVPFFNGFGSFQGLFWWDTDFAFP